MADDAFYYAFEERHRGSRTLIKSRLSIYLPFVNPLMEFYSRPSAVDLGCGRGEWLELMAENGFNAKGIDINDRMLEVSRSLGFSVEKMDAVEALEALNDNSQAVVTAFHLVEHLPFETVDKLVKEAQRVLVPGGILIIETPNPENLIVSSTNFYLDPTHLRPIPPQLLSFLVEYHGFFRHKILRLQQPIDVLTTKTTLWNVFSGVSPDYAVVAQKGSSDAGMLSKFDSIFDISKPVGTKIDQMALKYDEDRTAEKSQLLKALTEKLDQASNAIALLSSRLAETESRLQRAEDDVKAARERAEASERRAEMERERVGRLELELNAVYNSRSWRVTRPLRLVFHQARLIKGQGFAARTKTIVKSVAKPILVRSITFFDSHPALRSRCINFIRKFGLYDNTRAFYRRVMYGRQEPQPAAARPVTDIELQQLSPRAHRIYLQLKEAMERHGRDDCR
ncbi:MAG: class I SAM-dependent methyltransferase [Dissulfurimicrobium hydrothermale]|uniref:class I SAM-dependent methyltransferase n=1 Tax=Dissulfurimicrobium hydrothermale TaxID=1750598 RepID=UPI003C7346FF